MNVKIEKEGDTIFVASPFNKEFVAGARNLSGKWLPAKWHEPDCKPVGAWCFDARDESSVRKLCMDVYGSDGLIVDQVDVRVTLEAGYSVERGPIEFCGHTIAWATGRDSGAKLGKGVVLEQGGFTSGGSRQYWTTEVGFSEDVVVVLRDVCRKAALATHSVAQAIEILTTAPTQKLLEERTRLLARLAEIDSALDGIKPMRAGAVTEIVMLDPDDSTILSRGTLAEFCAANCDDEDAVSQVKALSVGESVLLDGGTAPSCLVYCWAKP